jgi:hypothetical protein
VGQDFKTTRVIALLAGTSLVAIGLGWAASPAPVLESQRPSYLDDFKQGKIVFASRAPNAGDQGKIWVKYTEGNDATLDIYLRHPRTGTWRLTVSGSVGAGGITDLTGDVTGTGPGSTAATIALLAVTTGKLADMAVDTAKLNSDAVTTLKILDANITTQKLADLLITTAKIAAAAVDTGNLATDSVTSAAILAGSVNTAKLGSAAVDTTKLSNGAVNTSKLAPAAVDSGKLGKDAVTANSIAARFRADRGAQSERRHFCRHRRQLPRYRNAR